MTAPNLSPLPPRRAKAKASKSRMSWKKILLLMAVIIIAGLGAASYYYYSKIDNLLNKVSSGSSETIAPEKSAKHKPLTLLVLGMDTRKETGSLNSDVIMVASLNPTNKSATIVSLPRDTYMTPKGFKGNKANSFYASLYQSDKNRADAKIKELFGTYFNVPIDYLAVMNFKGFEDVVDELGGITVDVDMDMRYVDSEDGTNINLRKGTQKLNGELALDFVRYRKSNRGTADSNDMQRNGRQQQVISAILDKLKSVGGIVKLGDVLDAVGNNARTDIPKQQLTDFMRTYIGIDSDKIQYIHLEGQWKSPYIHISAADLKNAQNALRQQLK